MNKTPHYWAVELAHNRIDYGKILEGQPDVLTLLKKAIFAASKEVIEEAVFHDRQQCLVCGHVWKKAAP